MNFGKFELKFFCFLIPSSLLYLTYIAASASGLGQYGVYGQQQQPSYKEQSITVTNNSFGQARTQSYSTYFQNGPMGEQTRMTVIKTGTI